MEAITGIYTHGLTCGVCGQADAIANRNDASFTHDPHQRDGDLDSNCMDFVCAHVRASFRNLGKDWFGQSTPWVWLPFR